MSDEVNILSQIVSFLDNGKRILEKPDSEKSEKLKGIWKRFTKEIDWFLTYSEGNSELVEWEVSDE